MLIPVIEPNHNLTKTIQNNSISKNYNEFIVEPEILFPGFISDDIINDLSSTELESEFLKYLNLEQSPQDEK